jgi:diguanylate cyclase (GGDEF)-like protein/PAS domain S-box-containing protein
MAEFPPDFHRRLLDQLGDGVYLTDRHRRITYWNRGAERLTGFNAQDVVGRRCKDGILMHCDDAGETLCGSRCPLKATMRDGEPRECQVYLHHRDGHRKPVHVRAAPLRDAAGEIVGAIEIFNDDSRAAILREELEQARALAVLDPVTGIGNRRFVESAIERRLGELHRYDWPFGLLFADIDAFKALNDEHGHEAGDDVLRTVARTLAYAARGSDSAGRWGGEEFVIVVGNVDADGLMAAAERVRALVERSRHMHGRSKLEVTVSVGATLGTPGDDLDGVVRRADALMYQAKDAGRNCVATDAPVIARTAAP